MWDTAWDAPGSNWHDYKDINVRGKIVMMFVNDPPPSDEEPNLFKADTLTYYGRWTYKYEEARRRGALGAILIHTTPTAGYPFTVLSNSAQGEQIQLATPPENPLNFKGWITQQSAERVAQLCGTTLSEWFDAAASREFQPQVLPLKVGTNMTFRVRHFSGLNVLGKLPGAVTPDEAIIHTAHHDHFGIGPPHNNDPIYNGAIDNASGVAMILTMAKAYSALPRPPDRTMLFASVTAEERGLLGSAFYARNPSLPLSQTVANLNYDVGNVYGKTHDIVGLGSETSDLGALLTTTAAAENMRVSGDPQPNQGMFFRSDQLSLARGGVPAVSMTYGKDFIGRPEGYYNQVKNNYNLHHYHQPSDEFNRTWAMGGMVQAMRIGLRMGYVLGRAGEWPAWLPGAAFAEARTASQSGG